MYDPRYQQQPYAPPPQAPRRSGWSIAGIGCLGFLGVIAVIAVIGAATHSPSASAPSSEPATAFQVAAPAPARTAAAPPATTAAAPAKPAVVATFHGSGSQNTPPFTVTTTWQIAYAFDCSSSFGGTGNFQVYEYDGNTPKGILANDLATSKSANSWAYDGPGTRHLQINSECSWTVEVADEG